MPDSKPKHAHPDREQDLELAAKAADGDPAFRKQVVEIAHPIIAYQADRFCKRFCYDNRYSYRCSLPVPWGSPPADAAMCEWGNASYAWMLDDLTKPGRLQKYEARGGSSLRNYLFQIANSLPFYERWKDWRLGRRVHVPTYVQDLAPYAGEVFLALRNREDVPMIAQRLVRTEEDISALAQRIVVELTKRRRLHLLEAEASLSYFEQSFADDDAAGKSFTIAADNPSPERLDADAKLAAAWGELSAAEQFILEATIVEERDANEVLDAFKKLDLSIVEGVPVQALNRQHVYYFRRKTLAKLASLSGLV